MHVQQGITDNCTDRRDDVLQVNYTHNYMGNKHACPRTGLIHILYTISIEDMCVGCSVKGAAQIDHASILFVKICL